ncbi:hypothetical protein V8J82_15765 [Gymnodinialimonas sp. 2305UL16-5]|uniref:DUF4870 family protein n=1 Tax=Gymnodinialimonas mytili TaxID=3126503 RepID=UPI0030A38564
MTDPSQSAPQPFGGDSPYQSAFIIYILYAVGFALALTALAGVVYAYIERGKDPGLDTHLSFQIRTFWWGLLMLAVGVPTSFVLIGLPILLFWAVWTLVRIITGIQLAHAQRPISGVEMLGMKAV